MTGSRRILITGLSSAWGGRLAQELERVAGIETILGIDTEDPRHELQRTEFVRVGPDETLLRRIVRAAEIDTIVDTRLITDAPMLATRRVHEVNVHDTQRILAAAGGADSPVRKVVFKSSADFYGAGRDDPAFFTEDMPSPRQPRGRVEHEVARAEQALREFSAENRGVLVTILRCANEIGAGLRSSRLALLGLPVVPAILGFDPRWQFVHEDDVVGAMGHAVTHQLPGAYNVAADGVLVLSEVAALLGKPIMPILPPWGTLFAGVQLRRLGLPVPVEVLRDLRHGRGLDNRRLKASGYSFRYTSREAVLKLRAHQRLRPMLGRGDDTYRYEREVEEFLRWSPSVHARPGGRPAGLVGPEDASVGGPAGRPSPPTADGVGYGELTEAELLEIIPSLESDAMLNLREHEEAGPARPEVLEEIDHQLALRATLGSG